MALSQEGRDKLKKLSKEISELETQAESNIAEAKEFVEFDVKELEGLPQPIIHKLLEKQPVPGKKGFVKITLDKHKSGAYL